MKTIIQTIGPLYGDDANGTVYGQPNGSVYTPPANIIRELSKQFQYAYVKNGAGVHICNSNGSTEATYAKFEVSGQVPYMWIAELATDSGFSSIVSSGNPNVSDYVRLEMFGQNSGYTVVNGTTYYARIRIVTKDGLNTMAVSDTYTLTGVV